MRIKFSSLGQKRWPTSHRNAKLATCRRRHAAAVTSARATQSSTPAAGDAKAATADLPTLPYQQAVAPNAASGGSAVPVQAAAAAGKPPRPSAGAAASGAQPQPTPLPPAQEQPGVLDDANFEAHWTVSFWRTRPVNEFLHRTNSAAALKTYANNALKGLQSTGAFSDATSTAYWGYHLARMGFFTAQGAASVFAQSALRGDLWRGHVTFIGGSTAPDNLAGRLVDFTNESVGVFEADLRLVKEGAYKLPWDMTTPGHRQSNPFYAAQQSTLYMQEALKVLGRRASQRPEEGARRLPYAHSGMYPDYYQNDFHFQSDGWFSSKSAQVYDVATETLFLGRQDAMQRLTMIPMSRWFSGSKGEGVRVLEVGAGTGRFATFVRDNYPLASLTVSDLSPFYLEKARDAMAYWEESTSGAVDDSRTDFLQCAAEVIPLPDASQDVVYSVYMFHEMPRHAREEALREMARVLKPGGLLVITDSVQLGDSRRRDSALGRFGSMNEPHYEDYICYNFGKALREIGLQPTLKCLASSTKSLSAVKPGP